MQTFKLADYGAVGNGIVNDTRSVQEAIAAAASTGGGIVLGELGAIYLITEDMEVTTSHIILDWQWAQLTGNHRFTFNGDSGTHGDRSNVLSSVGFRRAYLMAYNEYPCPRGLKLQWCDDSFVEDVRKDGETGTAFNICMCRRCRVSRVTNRQGRDHPGPDTNTPIGLLIWHSEETLVEDCTVDGAGKPFSHGIQVKGGRDNRILRCTIRNVKHGEHKKVKPCFYDRGDAPWKDSASGRETPTYPFEPNHCEPGENPWLYYDKRRASLRTLFRDCRVLDCDGTSYKSQEAIETFFECCVSEGSGASGIAFVRADNGDERGSRVVRCSVFDPAHVGISVAGNNNTLIPDVTIENCHVSGAGYEGIRAKNTQRLRLDRCIVLNSGQDNYRRNRDGIYLFETNERPEVTHCVASDDQENPTQDNGITIMPGTTGIRLESCTAVGNRLCQIKLNDNEIVNPYIWLS